MELIVLYLVLVAGIGWWAAQWGRSVAGWVVVAILLSPLLAALGLLIRGRNPVRAAPPAVPVTGEHWQQRDAPPVTGEHWRQP